MAALSFSSAPAATLATITAAAAHKQHPPLVFSSSPKHLQPLRSGRSLSWISVSSSSKRSILQSLRSSSLSTAVSVISPLESESDAPQRNLKSRLTAGETLYGIFLMSNSPTVAEIAGLAGYDYVVVDMEHSPGGISDALACLRALAGVRTPAILRLPEPSAVWAKKALDLGPQGIMFPMIENPAAAADAVACCRFPPRGVRGSAHTVVRASAYGLDDGYLARCEEELLVMCQVESAAGVAEIEAIAAVEGVDVVQMGPLDLSASMGYLWDPGNRKVRAALKEAERKVLAVRKLRGEADAAAEGSGVAAPAKGGPFLGGFAMPHDPPEEMKTRGYHMVSGAVDVGLFRRAAVEDVRRFRSAEADIGEDEDDEKPRDESYWSE